MIEISYKIFPVEFYNADSGSPNLNSRILDKMKAVLTATAKKSSENSSWIFNAANKTITINNDQTLLSGLGTDTPVFNSNFEDLRQKYIIGEQFDSVGTLSNNTNFTITDISETTLTVSVAPTDEITGSSSIFVTSKINALDFYFNLVDNNTDENYYSLTDKGSLQRYSVSGLDASDTSTHHLFSATTRSNGWVTDVLTGQVSQCDIVGAGISNYIQTFTVTHYFIQSPLFLREQIQNFTSQLPPEEFQNGNSLRYICHFDAKYSATTTIIEDSGSLISVQGSSCWFGSVSFDTRPQYSFDYITYVDHVSSTVLSALDANRIIDVTIGIKANSALFSNANTRLILNHIYCPSDESVYMNTQTTMRQNLMNDRCSLKLGDSAQSGEFHGTNYQVFSNNIAAIFVDTTHCKVTFSVSYSTFLKTFLKARSDTDRQYAFSITTQNYTLTSTTSIDRVAILCDLNNANFDTRDSSLLKPALATSGGWLVYQFPNINTAPYKNIAGYEGDPFYIQYPAQLLCNPINGVTPTLSKIGMRVKAIKSGKEDFIIEEKIFDTALIRKLKDTCSSAEGFQEIDFSESRGFVSTSNDPYNSFKLYRDKQYDINTTNIYAGFVMQYGLVLRYETWLEIFNGQVELTTDIAGDIKDINEQWTNLSLCGWSLCMEFYSEVIGYDGNVTAFTDTCPITILNINASAGDNVIDDTKSIIQFYDELDNEIKSIKKGGITRVIATYYGDLTNIPGSFDHIWGYAFADLRNNGSIFTRRFSSSEYSSEDDSPFSDALPYVLPDSSGTVGNIRVNVYGTTSVSLSFFYDDTKQNWSKENNTIIPVTRIGWSEGGSFDNSFDGSFDM